MNWLDVIIIVVVAIAALIGMRIGVIKAVLSLVGVIVGVVLAGNYYMPFSEQLSFIPWAGVAKVVAFVIILIGVMVVATVLSRLLKWAASVVMLGWVNSLGGAIFGLALGAIFFGAILAIWVKYLGVNELITESALAAILLDKFPMVLALLPSEFDGIRSFFQ